MAIDVTIDTTIARPPGEVFERVADVAAWPSWLIASGIRRVARSATGPVVAGEALVVDQNAAGRAASFDATVTALEPASRLTLHGTDSDGVTIDIDARIAPDGAGTTLRWSIKISLPFRYRIFESMARPQVERAAALDVEALRRGLESAPND